jgi:hypothetical protein
MKSKDKIVCDGAVYYSVAATAKLLGMTKPQVKTAMGSGQLEWAQFKPNGPLYVTAISLVAQLKRKNG